MKKKKYGSGTGRNGVVRNYIENPNDALIENQIAIDRAEFEAASNPWIQGLQIAGSMAMNYGMNQMSGATVGDFKNDIGALGKQTAAYGGKIGAEVEVEGKEVAETPDGKMMEFKGPSHEEGGIDVNLPGGTDVYSKRVKVDGVSMADRKKKRERKELTLEKLLKDNSTDAVNKNTLNRVKSNNEKEEERDIQVQELISNLLEPKKEKFAMGGPVPGGIDINALMQMLTQMQSMPDFQNMTGTTQDLATPNIPIPTQNKNGVTPIPTEPFSQVDTTIPLGEGTPINLPPNNNQNLTWQSTSVGNTDETVAGKEGGDMDFLNMLTGGDAVSLIGDLVSTFGPMLNTKENRAGDTPNINHYKDFGNDALDVLDETKGYVGDMKDNALLDLETARTGNVKRNRNTARGVNTMRSLDLASSAQANQAQGNIYDVFARQMMQILNQEAGVENQQDSMVMQGEERKDIADRQDRDNFYTQMAQDIATKGTGLQETGKDLNAIKQNQVVENLINQLSKYGITIDGQGNLKSNK